LLFQAITWILELCEVMANTHTNMGKTHEEDSIKNPPNNETWEAV
jgi:hypothetical protein